MKLSISRSWEGRSLDARRTVFIYWYLRCERSLTIPYGRWLGTKPLGARLLP